MSGTPTIVLASLDDEKLRQSITNLVAHVKRATHTMLTDTNSTVDAMEKKLKSLGNIKIDSGSSADGGASKRTKAQNADTEAIEKNIATRDRQIKKNQEAAMSFDQITAALDKARRTVSDFNTKRASGILPSSEDYKRYEQALARIVEYNDKLKQSALSRADANQWANVFDAKATIRDLTAVDDRYKKLVRWYTVLEKEDQRRIARDDKDTQKRIANAEKERAAREKMIESARKAEQKYQDATLKSAFRGALTLPTNDIDELRYKIERITTLTSTLRKEGLIDEAQVNRANAAVTKLNEQLNKQLSTEKEVKSVQSQQTQPQVKSARDSYYAFVAGLKEQRESLAKVINDFERGLNNAISKRTNEINNQIAASKNKIQDLNQELNRANATRNAARASQVQGQLDKELRHYKYLELQLKNVNNEFSTSKISLAAMNAEHHRLANLMREETQATRQQITEEQRRTEEIRKQAAAIRATKTWQEKGYAEVNGHVFKDPERVRGTMQQKREIGTLEEQILRTMQQQSIAERANTQEAQQHLETIKGIAAAARAEMKQEGTSAYWHGYHRAQDPYIYAENDARAKGLTIEQQIEKVLREEAAGYQASAKSAKEVFEEEKKITEEQDKRKRYKAPVTTGNESFKQLTANALGVQPSEIDSTSTKIAKMTAYVRQLETAYSNLKIEERSTPFGKQLREEIQTTSRTIQKFRSEISRPINLQAALQGSEKTLDDIAYKMQRLSSYRSGLNIETQKNEIDQVNRKYAELQKKMNEVMQKNSQMVSSNNILTSSWRYMRNRLAFYFSVGASTQFIKNLIEVRSQYELNERALGILIGSAERGTQIFNELSQMSLVSPYTLIELSAAAKQLTAYDIAARDVVDTTRRLADMASAVGVPIERLTYALGQIKAYGYLNSRDQRMFANAGIPLAAELAKYYTEIEGKLVSTGDVYDRIKKKAVDYNDVMQVMYRMTDEGGKFFDFQAKMADTLKTRLANLTLAWNNMLNDMGKETQGVLTWGIGALRTLFLHWKELDKLIKNIAWIVGLRTAFMLLAYGALKLGGAIGVTTKQMALSAVFGKRLAGVLRTVGMTMKSIVASPLTWWSLLAMAAFEAATQIFSANEATVSLNKSLREGAETNFKDISDYLAQYQKVADSLYSGKKTNNAYDLRTGKVESEASTPTDINVDEANKAWEAMRERIELSTAASDDFVGRLLTIENVSERLRQGFKLLNDIQQVNSAMKELGDTAIVVTQDWSKWWNYFMGSDGLINNLKDYKNAQDGATFSMEKFGQGLWRQTNIVGVVYNIINGFANDEDKAFKNLKSDIDDTTESIDNFIRNMGFASNPDQIAEVYAQALQKISAQGNLDPQQAYILQQSMEEARGKAMREALEARIADEEAALKLARDYETKESLSASKQRHEAQLELFTKYTDDQRTEWERFTKYIKENHISEMQAMFGQMDEEQISHINWQEGKYLDFVKRTAAAYAKRHNMAYEEVFNRLWGLIHKTNLMQIFLKLTISTEGQKSITDLLVEYDQQADAALTKIQRNQRRLQEMVAMGWNSAISKYYKEYLQLKRETDDLIANYNDVTSKEKGGHAKQADKANEKAAKAAAAARKKEVSAAAKTERQAESELAKALGNEIQLINEAKSEYKKLEDAGYETFSALEIIQKRFSQSVKNINAVLAKNNIPLFDLSKFTGASNPRFLLNMLEEQIKALKNNPRVKAAETQKFEIEFSKVDIDAKAYDSKKIAEGLDNSLSRLKDEYELAIALDADPELGNLFADWMGIDTSVLPRTVQEYAERATKYLNQYLNENKAQLTIPDILNLTSDDIRAFEEGTKTGLYNKEWVERIKKTYEDAANYRKKDMEDAVKQWNNLIQKYGDLQDQLTKIEKDAMVEQAEVIKHLGDEEQKRRAVDITRMIAITKDPEELARLTSELLTLLQAVSEKSQKGVSVTKAISNEKKQKTSKAYWDDFKNSNLYALTFDDMANNSTRAIQLIITKLNDLKDKVKEDPASMKALMDSLQKAEEELNARNPFKAVIDGLKEWYRATKEVKQAELELKLAQQQQTILQNAYNKALKEGDPVIIAAAQENLATATQRVNNAEEGLVNAENKAQKGLNKFKTNLSNTAQYLQQVSDGIKAVEDIMKTLGADEDTVEFIEAINSGFQKMITILMAVAAAITVIIILRSTLNAVAPELLIISAALAVIIGMIQFLDSHKNNKINEEVKKSEREVKRLETAYKNLEVAIDEAYGTTVVGAKQAAIANKELQLAELRRQLQLELSRKKKHRDEDKIQDLRSQIIDLQNDIRKSYQEIATELLGFSDVGDAAEDLIGTFIDNLRSGEDAMASFTTSVKDMIANLVKNMIVTKVIGPQLEALVDDMNERIRARSEYEAEAYEKAVEQQTQAASLSENEIIQKIIDQRQEELMKQGEERIIARMKAIQQGITQEDIDSYLDVYQQEVQQEVKRTKKELDKKTTPTLEDIDLVAKSAYDLVPTLEGWEGRINEILKRYDLFKDTSDKQLSALQQGISGITEEQASALEAYWNINTQEQFKHTTLLTQIRDLLSAPSGDVQIGVQAQMLLQLQQSYQVQMSIHSTLQGWTNPSGQAVRVELIS